MAANQQNPRRALVEAALGLAAREGWAALDLTRVIADAGLSAADIYAVCPDMTGLSICVIEELDAQGMALLEPPQAGAPVRDGLFDVVMARCDAMQEYRDGVCALHDYLKDDLLASAAVATAHLGSARAMLGVAGASAPLHLLPLQTVFFARQLRRVYTAWRQDDSADMAETMRILDEVLQEAESWGKRFGLKSD